MGKKLTKKKALEIAEDAYNNSIELDGELYPICNIFKDTNLYDDWCDYWKDINTDTKVFMYHYFYYKNYASCKEEDELLRLLTLHMFIEDVYE